MQWKTSEAPNPADPDRGGCLGDSERSDLASPDLEGRRLAMLSSGRPGPSASFLENWEKGLFG